ncbi:hypothetical protein GCM10012275_29140 [Longimycelium tulufanense]|uniref:Uncharacterized protein n=1 Tax=Longimycelium tulufanense TaxID=907463 RepID=A0A8J3C8I9_9PSEU|nr:hypothetical protein GCM10012275_29140 [Longimycelium tulufanense]
MGAVAVPEHEGNSAKRTLASQSLQSMDDRGWRGTRNTPHGSDAPTIAHHAACHYALGNKFPFGQHSPPEQSNNEPVH